MAVLQILLVLCCFVGGNTQVPFGFSPLITNGLYNDRSLFSIGIINPAITARQLSTPRVSTGVRRRILSNPLEAFSGLSARRFKTTEPSFYLPSISGGTDQASASQLIISGTDVAQTGKYPWQASLQIFDGQLWRHICGASLIDNQLVLTSAHCILTGYPFRVVLGTLDLNGPGQAFAVTNIVVHPRYDENFTGYPNDLAVIKLASPVTYSNNIRPITLHQGGAITSTDQCVITGWGYTDAPGGTVPTVLQEAPTRVMDLRTCREIWNDVANPVGNYIWYYHVCIYNEGNTSACNGDSGGPLVCTVSGRQELVGVTSFGVNGCDPGVPNVYAGVFYNLAWITDTILRMRV